MKIKAHLGTKLINKFYGENELGSVSQTILRTVDKRDEDIALIDENNFSG